jgi:hypothetical protein
LIGPAIGGSILGKGLEAENTSCPVAQAVSNIIFPGQSKFPAGGGAIFIDAAFDMTAHLAFKGNTSRLGGFGSFHAPLGVI